MNEQTFHISGKVINDKTRAGIPQLRIEAWDNDLIVDDLVGSALTDSEGRFLMTIKDSDFSDIFLKRSPDLFFKIFPEGELIFTTRNSILWNVSSSDTDIVIELDLSSGADGTPDES